MVSIYSARLSIFKRKKCKIYILILKLGKILVKSLSYFTESRKIPKSSSVAFKASYFS